MGAGNTHPSGAHSVLSGIRVAQSSDFVSWYLWNIVCLYILFLLTIVFSSLHRITASAYTFDVLKRFMHSNLMSSTY